MNKLIELINVFRKEKYPKSKLRYYKYDSLNHEFLSNCIPNDSEEKVLGRRFGFIKRLVENNKIDKDKVIELEHNGIRPFKLDNLYGEIKLEERLLMLLSIQDNPIEFLISILK